VQEDAGYPGKKGVGREKTNWKKGAEEEKNLGPVTKNNFFPSFF
jgi:hypothetical protein